MHGIPGSGKSVLAMLPRTFIQKWFVSLYGKEESEMDKRGGWRKWMKWMNEVSSVLTKLRHRAGMVKFWRTRDELHKYLTALSPSLPMEVLANPALATPFLAEPSQIIGLY